MNTKEMLSVIELSKSLSFRETAERLYMSQPALSYQIAAVESEVGFSIFDRTGRSVALTPAGRVFVSDLEKVLRDLHFAVERGQNFSTHFDKEIRVGLPRRSYFPALPAVLEKMGRERPDLSIAPVFAPNGLLAAFAKGEVDLIIADEEDLKGVKDAKRVPLYRSPIRLLVAKDDPLTALPIVKKTDLSGRTLLVGSVSRKNLRRLQIELEDEGVVRTFNSDSHDTTLTLVAAGKAVCLSPDFYRAEGGECAWLAYDTDAFIQISLLMPFGPVGSDLSRLVDLLIESAKTQK
ncbi:MAG: LysR family transcriptional regulator [Clostridia bacterium]|nr:LysR family transcriptional regulator [Clostridia bacterium]